MPAASANGKKALAAHKSSRLGMRRFNMGSASAMSTVLTVALLAVSLLCLSFLRERTPKEKKR